MTHTHEPPTRVLRWDVRVDDRWHDIGTGPVVLVAIRNLGAGASTSMVEVWTREPTTRAVTPTRPVRAYGTGHHVPADAEHIGSAVVPGIRLVWHLFGPPAPIDTTANPDTPNGPR